MVPLTKGHASSTAPVFMLQRDAIVGHAEAIRTQSRKLSKAHTHKKRQPTNAGQPHSTRRKEATPQLGAAHAASEDTITADGEVLQRRKAGEVGPQRSGTLSPNYVAREIEVLQGRNVGRRAPALLHLLCSMFLCPQAGVCDQLQCWGTQRAVQPFEGREEARKAANINCQR